MKSMTRRSVDLSGDLPVDLLDSSMKSNSRRSVDFSPYRETPSSTGTPSRHGVLLAGSPIPMHGDNMAPADRFAQVRENIKYWQAVEKAMKNAFLSGEYDMHGDDFHVVITERKQERVNVKLAKAVLGDALTPFMVADNITFVHIKKNDNGEV